LQGFPVFPDFLPTSSLPNLKSPTSIIKIFIIIIKNFIIKVGGLRLGDEPVSRKTGKTGNPCKTQQKTRKNYKSLGKARKRKETYIASNVFQKSFPV